MPVSPAVILPALGIVGDPARVPEYALEEELGRGGSAVVYAAHHATLDRTVAIKVLRGDAADHGAAALIQEARIMGQLSHPQILPVHALGQDGDGKPMLVMRKADGVSWQALIQDPTHPVWAHLPGDAIDRSVRITLQLADALSCAHDGGVLHRDVKPANVVLGRRGEVTLVDWGLAARMDPTGVLQTAPAGSPPFMAPEMFGCPATLDVRTDVFLLGATLWTALTGAPPRRSADGTLDGGDLPGELRQVLTQALAVAPADRFATMDHFRQALVAFVDHRSALTLAVRAEARLHAALAPEAPDRHGRMAEARFGFQAALAAWPACVRAQEGIEHILEQTIVDDLSRGDAGAARRSFAQLTRPRPDLDARISAVEAQSRTDQRELDHTRQRREGLAPAAGVKARRLWTPLMLLLVVLGPIRIGLFRLGGILPVDFIPAPRWLAPLVVGVLLEVPLRRMNTTLPGRMFNRHLVRIGQVSVLMVSANWAAGWWRASAVDQLVQNNFIALAGLFTVCGHILDRRFWWIVGACIAGVGATALAPHGAELFQGLWIGAAVLAADRAWQRSPGQPG